MSRHPSSIGPQKLKLSTHAAGPWSPSNPPLDICGQTRFTCSRQTKCFPAASAFPKGPIMVRAYHSCAAKLRKMRCGDLLSPLAFAFPKGVTQRRLSHSVRPRYLRPCPGDSIAHCRREAPFRLLVLFLYTRGDCRPEKSVQPIFCKLSWPTRICRPLVRSQHRRVLQTSMETSLNMICLYPTTCRLVVAVEHRASRPSRAQCPQGDIAWMLLSS